MKDKRKKSIGDMTLAELYHNWRKLNAAKKAAITAVCALSAALIIFVPYKISHYISGSESLTVSEAHSGFVAPPTSEPVPTSVSTYRPHPATEPPAPKPTEAPTAAQNSAPQQTPEQAYAVTTVSNVVFYGDSWMDTSSFRSQYEPQNTVRAKGAEWAQYFVQNNLVTPQPGAKAVFVQFGMNDWQTAETGLSGESYMKKFLDLLAENHPGIPILVTKSPHTAQAYVSARGKDINPRCDKYSEYVKQYCDSTPNFYFVDVTSCLNDSSGWLRTDYADSSAFHLTQAGCDAWTNAINDILLKALNGQLS